jgi:starch phosphorylase
MPDFEGKVLLVEGYDMALARDLVMGVDVWLNTPEYPFEASGTSGQKAAMNGALNLSVLDGWWGEGYDGANGWAIKPNTAVSDARRRNQEEAASLYDVLANHVLPLYYHRDDHEYSLGWVVRSKHAMKTLLPRFGAGRMMEEYLSRLYVPASRQARRFSRDGFVDATALARWKDRIRAAWGGVAMRRIGAALESEQFGSAVPLEVAVDLSGLDPADVRVECVLSRPNLPLDLEGREIAQLSPTGDADGGATRFALALKPERSGLLTYNIRMYPFHELLTHPHEMGLMLYL